MVPDQVECRCFWRRDVNEAAGSIELLGAYAAGVPSLNECDANATACNGPSGFFQYDLELLGSMMRRTMELCRGQQTNVVSGPHEFHEGRNEVICRQAPDRAILRRNNHVKTPRR